MAQHHVGRVRAVYREGIIDRQRQTRGQRSPTGRCAQLRIPLGGHRDIATIDGRAGIQKIGVRVPDQFVSCCGSRKGKWGTVRQRNGQLRRFRGKRRGVLGQERHPTHAGCHSAALDGRQRIARNPIGGVVPHGRVAGRRPGTKIHAANGHRGIVDVGFGVLLEHVPRDVLGVNEDRSVDDGGDHQRPGVDRCPIAYGSQGRRRTVQHQRRRADGLDVDVTDHVGRYGHSPCGRDIAFDDHRGDSGDHAARVADGDVVPSRRGQVDVPRGIDRHAKVDGNHLGVNRQPAAHQR